ncbi:MAG: UPF0182 family protein [SAR202 cluster bacterium]|nr:UPF0182 family protein [SAR202 cluster bacterium]|tara:strand:- start:4852 stop:7632 length:2781 start_codon:yes stop_codon:yes gene_type:complete
MSTGSLPPLDFEQILNNNPLKGKLKWIVPAVSLVLVLILLSLFKSIYTDWLWFDSLGYQGIYRKVLFTKIALFVIGFLVTFTFVLMSLYFANKNTSGIIQSTIPVALDGLIRKIKLIAILLIALILSIIMGVSFSSKWELFLRFTNAETFGLLDPVYSKDVGFFIFELPAYSFIQGWVLVVFVFCLILSIVMSFLNYSLRGIPFDAKNKFLRIQLALIAVGIILTVSAGLWINRLELVQSPGGLIFGATYADLATRQPALFILPILGVLLAVIVLPLAIYGKIRFALTGIGAWVGLIVISTTFIPFAMQTFSVDPNEFVKEEQYILRNMEFTREGFGLNNIEKTFYEAEGDIDSNLISKNLSTIQNIRLWDYRPLTDVYKQIQLIRPYYDFKDADVDRYFIDGEYRQVLLAAREVAPEKLDESAQTWVNRKLYYTHGIGIAMSPVTEFTGEGRPEFFSKDIPANGEIPISAPGSLDSPDILVSNPRIYYGENTTDYVLVNTNTEELDYQTGEGVLAKTNYQGDGGVNVGSFVRKLIYAWEMGDINILISSELNPDSKIQYRRQIQKRIDTVAPFLTLDKDPYIVADQGQLFWVQDAYTTSSNMPYSNPIYDSDSRSSYNYIRNSIKIVVNAFNGDIDFYLWDKSDPIALTYSRIFPEMFIDSTEMPDSLKQHMRFPQGLFSVQASKYIKYHMEEPELFYGNEDLWALPQEKFGQSETLQLVEPYYVIMRLPGESSEEFVLLMPYTPNDRPNMVGWLAARSDGGNYGKLAAYNFPKDKQVDGPEQVEARIDNDQEISAWFTLRCSEGSTCIRGNLLVIPIGNSILYAEPIYIQAEGVSFPELKKVVLATKDNVVMGDSLEDALTMLTGVETVLTEPVIEVDSDSGVNEIQDSVNISNINSEKIMELLDSLKDDIKGIESLIEEMIKE